VRSASGYDPRRCRSFPPGRPGRTSCTGDRGPRRRFTIGRGVSLCGWIKRPRSLASPSIVTSPSAFSPTVDITSTGLNPEPPRRTAPRQTDQICHPTSRGVMPQGHADYAVRVQLCASSRPTANRDNAGLPVSGRQPAHLFAARSASAGPSPLHPAGSPAALAVWQSPSSVYARARRSGNRHHTTPL